MLAASLSGCFSKMNVSYEDLAVTEKIAIVSIAMPKIADTSRDTNRQILQTSLNYARERVVQNLQRVRSWSVVEPAGAKAKKAVRAFGTLSDDELRAGLPPGAGSGDLRKEVDQERSRWMDQYLGAEPFPAVPRSALIPESWSGKDGGRVQAILLDQARKLCAALDVDAVVFVHIEAAITHPRGSAFLVKENRTDGMLQMAQSLVMVHRTGKIIADLGEPELDRRAANRDLLPLYLGSGRDAVKAANIDLGDPREKVSQALRSIIDETAADMAARFKRLASR